MGETIRLVTVALAAATLCVQNGCVGEQTEESADQERDRSYPTVAVTDTVAAVGYSVFDTVVHSQEPRKVEYRLLALQNAERPALVKALRLALDSIGRADTTLVAARGVLYLYEAAGPRRGNLVPRLWGEWVPHVGWDSASAASRRVPHVVYTYNLPPPGHRPETRSR